MSSHPRTFLMLSALLLCSLCLSSNSVLFTRADDAAAVAEPSSSGATAPGFCASHAACPPQMPVCVSGACTNSTLGLNTTQLINATVGAKSACTVNSCGALRQCNQITKTCEPVESKPPTIPSSSSTDSTFSTPTTTSTNPYARAGQDLVDNTGCFSASSIVERVTSACAGNSWSSWTPTSLANFERCVERVNLRELKLGDLIRSVPAKGLAPYFEPVIDLSHSSTDVERSNLIQLRTADEHSITLTHDHLLYVRKTIDASQAGVLNFQGSQLVAASEVVLGDKIGIVAEKSSEMEWAAVEAINMVAVTGVRNVWTRSARLIIDGMLASPFREETFAPYSAVQQTVSNFASGLGLVAETQAAVHIIYMGAIEMYFRLPNLSMHIVLALASVVIGLKSAKQFPLALLAKEQPL